MTDVESPEQQPKDMNGSVNEANNGPHTGPAENPKQEDVEMTTIPNKTIIDFEVSPLLPVLIPDTDQIKPSRRSSTSSKRRKSSVKIDPSLPDAFYDDADWETDEEEEEEEEKKKLSRNPLALLVQGIQKLVKVAFAFLNRVTRGHLVAIICLAAYTIYFIRAMAHKTDGEPAKRLICCTIFGIFVVVRKHLYRLVKNAFLKVNGGPELPPKADLVIKKVRLATRWLLYVALTAGMVYAIIDQADKNSTSLRSLPGLGAFMLVCLLFSTSPGNINWHLVYWGFSLQFMFALFALRWETGRDVIEWMQDRLSEFYANGLKGSAFMFGQSYMDHQFVFESIPKILLANAMLSILYYLGAMQFIIRAIGSFLCFVLDASPIEAMSVANSIFMEGIISVLSIKPYLGRLTKSQLFVVITSTFSSLGGAYMGTLVSIGISLKDMIPAIVISAPATFAVCKLMMPESTKMLKKQKKEGTGNFDWDYTEAEEEKPVNIFHAAQYGAISMIMVAGHFIAVGYTFVSLISWTNITLEWFGRRVDIDDLTIEKAFSYILFPVSLAMGVAWDDCRRVAMLIGYRIASINIMAFVKLVGMKMNKAQYYQYMMATNYTGTITDDGIDITLDLWNTTLTNGFISERSDTIVTYSLCGLSSFLLGAITLGIMCTLLPRRRTWIARVFFPALLAGNIANCMTGCCAGIFL